VCIAWYLLRLRNHCLWQCDRAYLSQGFINRVLSANGLSNVIPISSRKVERWDVWTKAKVVIGKSNGSGANKTKFNLRQN
jgi:hypothetical protein